MLRKVLWGLGGLLGLVVLLVVALIGYASYQTGRTWSAPLPPIQAATDAASLARGEKIFNSVCADCHSGELDPRPVGKVLKEFPSFLGTISAANLTRDRDVGIGAYSDGELARMIKTGLARDGKIRLMPPFREMGDADVAALVGYILHSDTPAFAPDPRKPPPSELSAVGKLVITFAFGIDPVAKTGIAVPPPGPTLDYGRYMAIAIYDCHNCHTPGFSGNKAHEPGAYAGGFENRDAEGRTYYSPNITFDDAGIGKWSLADFTRAMREGVTPGGYVIRPPMPKLRFADDAELEAIYKYLQSVPKQPSANKTGTAPRPKAGTSLDARQLFTELGCESCHGPNGIYRSRLAQAKGKAAEQVAEWILTPQKFRPGTQMPTYAQIVSPEQAKGLAQFVLDTLK